MARKRDRRRPAAPLPEGADGPPTVVSVEMEYGLEWPLVDRSPGVVGMLDLAPQHLGVSAGLAGRLRELARRWDALSRRWVHDEDRTPVSDREEAQWARDQLELAYDLQHELGSRIEVLADGLPLEEARRRGG